MGNAARFQSGASPVVLVAPARRELGVAVGLGIVFVVALAALVSRVAGLGERPAIVDVIVCIVLVPLIVGLGCALPLAASQVRRIRSRVVLDEEGLTLRDGTTVPGSTSPGSTATPPARAASGCGCTSGRRRPPPAVPPWPNPFRSRSPCAAWPPRRIGRQR